MVNKVRVVSALVVAAGLLLGLTLSRDPCPVLVLRPSDQSSLADNLPETSEELSVVEGSKLVPLENYHSGEQNSTFYLFGRDRARFRLEYMAPRGDERPVEIAFLLNHRFIRPRFEQPRSVMEAEGAYLVPVTAGKLMTLTFEVPVPDENAAELHVVVSSRVGAVHARPGDDVLPFAQAYLHHANLVKNRYTLPTVRTYHAPDVRGVARADRGQELVVLRRGLSVALLNNTDSTQRVLLAQPGREPVYLSVPPGEVQTHRDVLADEHGTVVVVDKPYTRSEDRFGFALGGATQAFLSRVGAS